MGIYAGACVRRTANGGIDAKYEIATSNQLIAGQDTNKSLKWFKENGIYKHDCELLIQSLA